MKAAPTFAVAVLAVASLFAFEPVVRASDTSFDGVYYGSFNDDGGQWALVSTGSYEPNGFYFVGFLPARRQLIVGSPYAWNILPADFGAAAGRFWDGGPYGFEGRIDSNGNVTGTAALAKAPFIVEGRNWWPAPYADASFSGSRDIPGTPASPVQGSWSWSSDYPSLFGRAVHAFVGPSGKAVVFVHDTEQGGADCGVGILDDAGNFRVSFAFGNRVIARLVDGKLAVDFPNAPQPAAPTTGQPVSRLTHFSLRGTTAFAARVGVVGTGKPVLIRAIGPGLQVFLPGSVVAGDPRLAIQSNSGALLYSNDNWEASTPYIDAFTAAGAFSLESGSKDAAVLTTLGGVNVVSFSSSGAGIGLLEVFEHGLNDDSRFSSFSVRHYTGGPTADPLIAGFTVQDTGAKTVLIRGLGPALGRAPFNVADMNYGPEGARVSYLADVSISLYRPGGSVVATNDDWPSSLASVFGRVGASSLAPESKDAAMLLTLPPGAYTVVLRGAGERIGDVLLEIFEVP